MNKKQIEKWGRQLGSEILVLGRIVQRQACRKLAQDSSAATVPFLVKALISEDDRVRTMAVAALRSLSSSEAIDALCNLAMLEPSGPAAKICIESNKLPSDPSRLHKFLFITGQFDAYFGNEDYQYWNLRQHLNRSTEPVHGKTPVVARSAEQLCFSFIRNSRTIPITDATDQELSRALQITLRQKNWKQLFKALMCLPLGSGLPLIEHLKMSDWQPDDPELKKLYQLVVNSSFWNRPSSAGAKETDSSLIEHWLEAGLNNKYSLLPESQLIDRLAKADPIEGVQIVCALSKISKPDSPAAKAVQTNPHWLIRMAGFRMGSGLGSEQKTSKEPNHWLALLQEVEQMLRLWPATITLTDVQALTDVTHPTSGGKLDELRKIFEALIRFRKSDPIWKDLQLEVWDDSAEFV